MKNFKLPIILIRYLLVFFTVSCAQDLDLKKSDSPEASLTISEAKRWFETNLQPVMSNNLKKLNTGGGPIFALLPYFNWDLAELHSNNKWAVVELPWEFQNGKTIFTGINGGTTSPGPDSDTDQIIKLVILRNQATQETFGFKMVILPDLFFLEKHRNFSEINYLNQDAEFSGQILFYSVLGHFVNGWIYENGKITGKLILNERDERASGTINFLKNSGDFFIEICWYQYFRYADGSESAHILLGCTSQSFTIYDNNSEVFGGYDFDGGGAGDGGSGGGAGVGSDPIVPLGKSEYIPSEGDVFFKKAFAKTVEPQMLSYCLFEAMTFVNRELCGGVVNVGQFVLSYSLRFSEPLEFVAAEGASAQNTLPFLNEYFNNAYSVSYWEAINNRWMIITDIAVSPGVTHAVVIVGYKQNLRLIYMDPLHGRLWEGHPNIFNQTFRFVARGCK